VGARGVNKATVDDSQGFQQAEINLNECAVCLGVCDADLIDGVLQKESIHVDYGCIVKA